MTLLLSDTTKRTISRKNSNSKQRLHTIQAFLLRSSNDVIEWGVSCLRFSADIGNL